MSYLKKCLLGVVGLFVVAGSASAQVLPADATNVREVRIFRNVSGASTTSGTGFVLQEANADANVLIGVDFGQESSLGLDVTTTTSDDAISFVGGQVDDTCLDDGLCRLGLVGGGGGGAGLGGGGGHNENTQPTLGGSGDNRRRWSVRVWDECRD